VNIVRKLINIEDYRLAAKRRLPCIAYDYLEPGAEDGVSCRWNRESFQELEFIPNVLRSVGEVDLSVRLFGHESRLPLVIGPTGFAGLFWPDGDCALASGAAKAGIPFVLSTASTTSIEDVAARCPLSEAQRWFQLYILKDQDANEAMIRRAESAGYGALVLTVDTPCGGKREASIRHGSRLPLRLDAEKLIDFMRHPQWSWDMLRHGQPHLANFPYSRKKPFVMEAHLKRQIGWDDVRWLRSRWNRTLILKGIQSMEDAATAAALGIDGVVLSNHGGRQLDGSRPPMQMLEEVVATVGERMTVMVDSGFRRGSDVLKALALGAKAVWLGRATLYGVAASGSAGASHVLSIMEEEMTRAMTLLGCAGIHDLNGSLIGRHVVARGQAGA
jgi:(S)-mandelate dehydrogenase